MVGLSYVWPALRPAGARGQLWRALWSYSILEAVGEGEFCPRARSGMQGPSDFAEDAQEKHLEASQELAWPDRSARGALDPEAAAGGASAVSLLKARGSAVAQEMKGHVSG